MQRHRVVANVKQAIEANQIRLAGKSTKKHYGGKADIVADAKL